MDMISRKLPENFKAGRKQYFISMDENIAEALQHILRKAKMDCWFDFHADADGMFFVWDAEEDEPMSWQEALAEIRDNADFQALGIGNEEAALFDQLCVRAGIGARKRYRIMVKETSVKEFVVSATSLSDAIESLERIADSGAGIDMENGIRFYRDAFAPPHADADGLAEADAKTDYIV